MKPENYIMKIMDEVPLMQLAAVGNDQPWVVSVYFAMDNLHNIYWISTNDRRHSKLIADNPKVAATVHMPYAPDKPSRAVQFEGTARPVPSEEAEALFQAYAEKFTRHALLPKLQDPKLSLTLYQFKATEFVLYDELNFPDSPRQDWTPID